MGLLMTEGELYTLESSYAKRYLFNRMGGGFYIEWRDQAALYVGKSVIDVAGGVTVTQLIFLLNGKERTTAASLSKYMVEAK